MQLSTQNAFQVIFPKYVELLTDSPQYTDDGLETFIRDELPHKIELVRSIEPTFLAFQTQFTNLILKRPKQQNLIQSLTLKASEKIQKLFYQFESSSDKHAKTTLTQHLSELNIQQLRNHFRSQLKDLGPLLKQKYFDSLNLDKHIEEQVAQRLYCLNELYYFLKNDITSIAAKFRIKEHQILNEINKPGSTGSSGIGVSQLIYLDEKLIENIREIVDKRYRPFSGKKDFFYSKVKQIQNESESKVPPNLHTLLQSILSKQKYRANKQITAALSKQLKTLDQTTEQQIQQDCKSIISDVDALKKQFNQLKNNVFYLDIIRGSFTQKYKMELNKLENVYYLSNIEKYLQDVQTFTQKLIRVEERIIDNRKNFMKRLGKDIEEKIATVTTDYELKNSSTQNLQQVIDAEFSALKDNLYGIIEEHASTNTKFVSPKNVQAIKQQKVSELQKRRHQVQKAKQEKQLQRRREMEEKAEKERFKREQDRIKLEQKRRAEDQRIRKMKLERQGAERTRKLEQAEKQKIRQIQMEQKRKQMKTKEEEQRERVRQQMKRKEQDKKRKQAEDAKLRQKMKSQKQIDEKRKLEEVQNKRIQVEEMKRKKQEQQRVEEQRQRQEKERNLKLKKEQEEKEQREREQRLQQQREDRQRREKQLKAQRDGEQQQRREQQERERKQKQAKLQKERRQKQLKEEQQRQRKQRQRQSQLERQKAEGDQKQRQRLEKVEKEKREREERQKRLREEREKREKKQRQEREEGQRKQKQERENREKREKQEREQREEKQLKEKEQKQRRQKQERQRRQREQRRQKQRKQQQQKQRLANQKQQKQRLQRQKRQKQQSQRQAKVKLQQKKRKQAEQKQRRQLQLLMQQQENMKKNKSKVSNDRKSKNGSGINYDDLDDIIDDDLEELEQQKDPRNKKAGEEEYGDDYQDDFESPEKDEENEEESKDEEEEGSGAMIEPKELITLQSAKCLNDYMKGTSYARKHKPNLEPFNNKQSYAYLFEQFSQSRKLFIFDSSVSKAILDFSKELMDENAMEDDLKMSIETIKEEMFNDYTSKIEEETFDPRTVLLLPFNFDNQFDLKLIEFLPEHGWFRPVIGKEIEDEEMEAKFNSVVEGLLLIFEIQNDPQVETTVIPESSRMVLETFDKDLPCLLLIFVMHYEMEQKQQIQITQYTVERFFYTLHILKPFYEAIENNQEDLVKFYEAAHEKYSQNEPIRILPLELQSSDPQYEGKLQQYSLQAKQMFLDDPKITTLLLLFQVLIAPQQQQEESGGSFQKISIYCSLERTSPKPTISYFIVSKDDVDKENASTLFDIVSEGDDGFEVNVFMDFTRHNGLNSYSDWTLPLWARSMQKRKLNAVNAFRAIAFSMAPYYIAYKEQD